MFLLIIFGTVIVLGVGVAAKIYLDKTNHDKKVTNLEFLGISAAMILVFVPLFVAGVETIDSVGRPGSYGEGIIHADYTHSVIGAVALSVAFGLAFGWRWGSRTAIVLGLVSFSHWVLDLLVHRADMPLFPSHDLDQIRFGIGLWRYPWAAAGLELLLVMMGSWLYWRAARAITRGDDMAHGRARLLSLLILIGGIVVLGLDVFGVGS